MTTPTQQLRLGRQFDPHDWSLRAEDQEGNLLFQHSKDNMGWGDAIEKAKSLINTNEAQKVTVSCGGKDGGCFTFRKRRNRQKANSF